jgi:hypothetical protein
MICELVCLMNWLPVFGINTIIHYKESDTINAERGTRNTERGTRNTERGTSKSVNNRFEIGNFQRSTTNQATINIRIRE